MAGSGFLLILLASGCLVVQGVTYVADRRRSARQLAVEGTRQHKHHSVIPFVIREYQDEEAERFLQACQVGDLQTVKRLAERRGLLAMVGVKDGFGDSCIHLAAKEGHQQILSHLLTSGWPVDQKGYWGGTPLHKASKGGHLFAATLLVRSGARVRSRDEGGDGPLHVAAIAGHVRVVDLLLREGARVDDRGEFDRTPLHWAALNGRLDLTQLLLASGADRTLVDQFGKVPRDWAVIWGHSHVVVLLEASPGVVLASTPAPAITTRPPTTTRAPTTTRSAPTTTTRAPVVPSSTQIPVEPAANSEEQAKKDWLSACRTGDMDVVTKTMETYGLRAVRRWKNEWKNACMIIAAWNGREAVVTYLLSQGWPVDQRGRDGRTALHWAAKGGHMSMVRALVEGAGADPRAKDEYGEEPVHWGAEDGHEQVVSYFLKEKDVPVDARGLKERTPLQKAAEHGRVEVARLLLALGADPHAKDQEGKTPLDWAKEKGHETLVKLLEVKDNFLRGCGEGSLELVAESVNEMGGVEGMLGWKNKWDNPGLHIAGWKGHDQVISYLLSQGWPPNHRGREGKTALFWTVKGGHLTPSVTLIRAGAEVRAKDDFENEPMHWAAEEGQVQAADLLLTEGAEVNAKGWKGRTPLHMAVKEGRVEMVKFLLSKGADAGVRDREGLTPLDWAKRNEEDDIVPLLEDLRTAEPIGLTITDAPYYYYYQRTDSTLDSTEGTTTMVYRLT